MRGYLPQVSRFALWISAVSLALTPALPMPGPDIRLDDLIPVVWLFAVLPFINMDLSRAEKIRLGALLAIMALIPVSIYAGWLVGFPAHPADFNQEIRLMKYVGVYLLSAATFRLFPGDFARMCWLAVPLLLLAIAQFIDLFGLNSAYVPIVAPTQYATLVNGYPYPRPVAMMGNPNVLGFAFVLFALASAHLAIRGNKAMVIPFAAAFVGLLLTTSRTSLIACIVGLAALVAPHVRLGTISRQRAVIATLAAIVVVAVLVLPPVYNAVTWRFATLLTMFSEASWTVRLQAWQENLTLFRDYPLFGVGPLRRANFQFSPDNEWLLIARSYGVIGVAAIVALLFAPLAVLRHSLAIAIATSTGLYMVAAASFHSLVLFPLTLACFAWADRPERDTRTPTQEDRNQQP